MVQQHTKHYFCIHSNLPLLWWKYCVQYNFPEKDGLILISFFTGLKTSLLHVSYLFSKYLQTIVFWNWLNLVKQETNSASWRSRLIGSLFSVALTPKHLINYTHDFTLIRFSSDQNNLVIKISACRVMRNEESTNLDKNIQNMFPAV